MNVVWPIEKPLHGSLLLTIIIFGCANVNSEYERVSRIDTVETYKSFLDKHPGSEFELRAKQRIEELEKEEQARKEKIAWQDAKEQNSVSSYVNFIKSYPKSKFVVDAKSAINTLIIEVALTNAGGDKKRIKDGIDFPIHTFSAEDIVRSYGAPLNVRFVVTLETRKGDTQKFVEKKFKNYPELNNYYLGLTSTTAQL